MQQMALTVKVSPDSDAFSLKTTVGTKNALDLKRQNCLLKVSHDYSTELLVADAKKRF